MPPREGGRFQGSRRLLDELELGVSPGPESFVDELDVGFVAARTAALDGQTRAPIDKSNIRFYCQIS